MVLKKVSFKNTKQNRKELELCWNRIDYRDPNHASAVVRAVAGRDKNFHMVEHRVRFRRVSKLIVGRSATPFVRMCTTRRTAFKRMLAWRVAVQMRIVREIYDQSTLL